LRQAFLDFVQRLPFYGGAVLCIDDPNVREILPAVTKPVTTYGLSSHARVRAVEVRPEGERMRFRVLRSDAHGARLPELDITLNLAGTHNVQNALAAVAVGMEVGASDTAIVKALAEFKGVGRRFERCGDIAVNGGHFTLIDDYGHHPAEVAATLAAARGAFPGRRLVLAFQPHRYTRTHDCFEDFVGVLSGVDVLLLTEVYAAGELPIAGANGRTLARAISAYGKVEPIFIENIADLATAIYSAARDGDLVLTMGAGSIGAVPAVLMESTVNGKR
jgi:UDP-N-acetylmuramate--alanine ligase